MPTPNIYKQISLNSMRFKWYFLGMVGIGFLICLLSILASVNYHINLFPLFGVGTLVALWGWGIFLIINWYGEKSKLALKFPKGLIVSAEWGGSIFLNLWFFVGSIGVALFIWNAK